MVGVPKNNAHLSVYTNRQKEKKNLIKLIYDLMD